MGTVFTYQGRLNDGVRAASGFYDFQFKLFDAVTAGAQQGSTVGVTAAGVTNGLFTVTVDFGAVFNGEARWLDISAHTNGTATFVPLVSRQPLTPAPYAAVLILAIGRQEPAKAGTPNFMGHDFTRYGVPASAGSGPKMSRPSAKGAWQGR